MFTRFSNPMQRPYIVTLVLLGSNDDLLNMQMIKLVAGSEKEAERRARDYARFRLGWVLDDGATLEILAADFEKIPTP